MTEAIICLGSNTADAEKNISLALSALSELGELTASKTYRSDGAYLNCVASLQTELKFSELHNEIKSIETALGRREFHKSRGKVIIDIDIVYFNSENMRPEDATKKYFLDGLQFLKDVKTVAKQ